MTTVGQLSTTVQEILNKLTIHTANITNSYNIMNNDAFTQSTIDSLNEKAATTDRKFEEAQYKFQASGGKSRKQTLQEFVILFFFVAYAALTISLILYSKAMGGSTLKTFAIMAFILLITSGIILRYA